MNFLIFLLCFLFIILLLKIDRRIYNPLVLFNFWWGVTIFISGFGFYGIYIPKLETYTIMLLGIISFNASSIFYFMLKKNINAVNVEPQINNINKYVQVNRLLLALHPFIIVELIRRTIVVIDLLSSGMSYTMIRYAYYYEDRIMPGYSSLINNWFISPVVTFSIIIVALNFFNKNYNKKLLYSTIILIGLTSFSSGSRNILVITAIVLAISFLLSGVKTSLNFTKKIKLFSLLLLIIISFFYVTGARTGANDIFDETFQHMVAYYTAPYIYFEKLSDYALENRVTLYGLTFFGGIWDVFITLLNFLGFNIKGISLYVGEYNQTYLLIGNGISFNAFPTMLYTFMYDLGLVGVILGSLFFGLFSNFIYFKMISSNNLAYKGMYVMVCIMIYQSVIKWVGIATDTWIVFLLFLIYEYISRRKFVFTK